MGVNYHLIGVGGIGMSALARILRDKGASVSGSDGCKTPLTMALEQEGISLTTEVSGTVVVSTAIPEDHPEILAAKKTGSPLIHRSELLRELAAPFKTLAVTGTHGKTTTASLLAWVLFQAELDPPFALGGILPTLNRNGRHGKGEYFVLEADESDGSFLRCDPYGAIVTGVEADHLEYWKTLGAIEQAFDQFITRVEGPLFWCGDDPYLRSKEPKGTAYGFGEQCPLRASNIQPHGFSLTFSAHYEGQTYTLSLPLTGRHNVLNALAVFGLARSLGLSSEVITSALATFPGSQRRCQVRTVARGVLCIDDYAHHPTEVKTTLEGLRKSVKEKRLVALFQPHRYTRLKACWEGFLSAFHSADEVWVTDVYSAGEAPLEGVTGEAFAKELAERIALPVTYVPQNSLESHSSAHLHPDDVLVGMGAGSVTDIIHHIADTLDARPVSKQTIGVVCGGPSFEHVISVTSGEAIAEAIPRETFNVKTFVVPRSGWGDDFPLAELMACDLIVPAFHGPDGEDGQFAALCETLGLPYVGCDPLSSALSMHKPKTKRMVQSLGVPTAPFVDVTHAEWKANRLECLRQTELLSFPLFVKTARSGSSLGVYKVHSMEELTSALESCFAFDSEALIEQGIVGREIEFAALGNEEVEVPPPGELLTYGRMYTYEAKYEQPFETDPSPHIPPDVLEKGRLLAERVYKGLGCSGLARVDFFLDETHQWWFNEINPFPGFTPISLYPKVWAANGLPFPELIRRLIHLGFARHRKKAMCQKAMQWIAR